MPYVRPNRTTCGFQAVLAANSNSAILLSPTPRVHAQISSHVEVYIQLYIQVYIQVYMYTLKHGQYFCLFTVAILKCDNVDISVTKSVRQGEAIKKL